MATAKHNAVKAALVALAVGMTAIPVSQSLAADGPPLVIRKQGSFAFGGTVVTGPDGDTFHGDHGYAQYQIPLNPRKYPMVMWHGGGQMGKTYESTPDDREGFQSLMLRRNWAVYIVDQPGRGRAARATVGTTIPDAVPGEASIWMIFRLGMWEPPAPPTFFPGVQFPQDPYAVDQYFRQQVAEATGLGNGCVGGDVVPAMNANVSAMSALLERIGPSILITHSCSGNQGFALATKSPNVKAIVSYEPAVFLYPEDEPPPPNGFAPAIKVTRAEFNELTKMPIQIVFGDNIPEEEGDVPQLDNWVRAVKAAKAFVSSINAAGGNAEVLELPKVGVTGNTHFPFSDLNNVQIADLLSQYLRRNGLDVYR